MYGFVCVCLSVCLCKAVYTYSIHFNSGNNSGKTNGNTENGKTKGGNIENGKTSDNIENGKTDGGDIENGETNGGDTENAQKYNCDNESYKNNANSKGVLVCNKKRKEMNRLILGDRRATIDEKYRQFSCSFLLSKQKTNQRLAFLLSFYRYC